MNRVYIIGRLGQKPELRRIASGAATCRLSVATDREWTAKDGERKKETTWVDVQCWERTAENAAQYLDKGSSLLVEGYLKMDTWEDKQTGDKRSKLYVQADRIQFLDGKPRDGEGGAPRSGGGGGRQAPARGGGGGRPQPARDDYADDDGEIPF